LLKKYTSILAVSISTYLATCYQEILNIMQQKVKRAAATGNEAQDTWLVQS